MTDPEPEPADTGEAGEAGEEPGDAEEAPAFENRAARRARSRGAGKPPPRGKGPFGAGRGPFQGPRQWGNRRSG